MNKIAVCIFYISLFLYLKYSPNTLNCTIRILGYVMIFPYILNCTIGILRNVMIFYII